MKRTKKQLLLFTFILILTLFLPSVTPFSMTAKAAVKLNTKKKNISVGETYQLTVKGTTKKIKWSSSNSAIVKVNQKGKITAKKSGTATITAKIGSKKLKCTVNVKSVSETDIVITIVNSERKKKGLAPLSKNTLLTEAANIRAKEIASYFSHTRPNGSMCFTAISSSYRYRTVGENIAYGYVNPTDVMNGWMNSPGHRSNILHANFEEIGVGMYEVNGRKYWVQMFGSQLK